MSSIIESLARTAVDAVPGIGEASEHAEAQKARGRTLMKDLTVGGVALGGGVGLGVTLLKYLKSLKEEEAAEDPRRLNGDTLYVSAKGHGNPEEDTEKVAASMERWLAPGLAVTGGVLGAGASYAIVKAIAERVERKRRLALLDAAQQETLQAVEQESSKQAAAHMTVADLLTASPVAIPLLAALSAGGISYAALNKAFPTIKRKKLDGPKRIKFVDDSGNVVSEEDVEKVASEMLLLMVDSLAREKAASYCVTTDILNFVAMHGKSAAMLYEDSADFYKDIEGTMEACMEDKIAAAKIIQDDHRLSTLVNATAAAEFADMLPQMFKVASSYDDEKMGHIICISALMHLDDARPHIKNASAILQDQIEDRDSALTSDAVGGMGEDADTTDASDSAAKSDDPVDGIMQGMKTTPIAPQ